MTYAYQSKTAYDPVYYTLPDNSDYSIISDMYQYYRNGDYEDVMELYYDYYDEDAPEEPSITAAFIDSRDETHPTLCGDIGLLINLFQSNQTDKSTVSFYNHWRFNIGCKRRGIDFIKMYKEQEKDE